MSRSDRATGLHLAILVPTKDRPGKVRDLLESLLAQTEPCGRILIIDGGEGLAEVVADFAGRLPLEHHVCKPPGQIRQRNMGTALLDERTPLVACLDDDIVLEPDAVRNIIAFWRACEPTTAAVGFNIVNTPPEPDTPLRRLFGLAGARPGRVLKSGATTSNCQAKTSYRAEWLCGGATVWRTDVLKTHMHRDVPARWAIAEDLLFSYPIGRRYPLYVCADARVAHNHVFDYRVSRPHRFHGYTRTVWTFHFVESNQELSRLRFLWMMAGTTTGRILAGLIKRDRAHLEFARGQIEGVVRGLYLVAKGRDLTELMRDPA